IPAASDAGSLSDAQFTMSENAMALADIQTMVVGARGDDSQNVITLSGKITVNEETVAVQPSYFEGRIEKLHVNFKGQEVRKGQLLATLYAPELVAAQQELLTAALLKGSQPQLYRAVRSKLKLWKLTDSQIEKIENSGQVLENFPLYATQSGTVTELMASEGDFVQEGAPLLRLSNLSTVWAAFDAYENQLAQLKVGQKISIKTNTHPDKVHKEVISFIDPVLDNKTRTLAVRATLTNQNQVFKPGMFVTGEVALNGKGQTDTTLMVPATAVMWTGERSLVYIKPSVGQPVFEMREVSLGSRVGDLYEITSGLQGGEEIVTHGAFTVDAAAQLLGKKSMMNPEGGTTRTGHEDHTGMQEGQRMEMELPASFQKGFESLLPAYLKMKDAFVASDAAAVAREALNASDQMGQLDRSGMGSMDKTHLDNSIRLLQNISGEEKLENQRSHFVDLNVHMVALASGVQSLESTLYVQLCPMANNNKGAVWLSTEKEIRNPYYGDEMLTCGKVERVLN
ncbi:MAG: efflux RND transporter periplasmic adaptor subunit, partial [Eudoraea sp.]|nr:efflux RND transporter periplasmic adaptor subunit [Eudoraea sp.]